MLEDFSQAEQLHKHHQVAALAMDLMDQETLHHRAHGILVQVAELVAPVQVIQVGQGVLVILPVHQLHIQLAVRDLLITQPTELLVAPILVMVVGAVVPITVVMVGPEVLVLLYLGISVLSAVLGEL